MKKLIIASNNNHKIKEIEEMMHGMNLRVCSLKDENIDIDVVEDGKTFEENAKKKAEEIYKYLIQRGDKEFLVMADDSGIAVDYLNGAPGIYSARYAGEHGNDSKNNEKLLKELKGVPKEKRTAQFVCQLALFDGNGNYYKVTGKVEGYIIEELHGEGGFGYDPLFFYEPFNKTFGESTAEEKNSVSHRAEALKKIKHILVKLI